MLQRSFYSSRADVFTIETWWLNWQCCPSNNKWGVGLIAVVYVFQKEENVCCKESLLWCNCLCGGVLKRTVLLSLLKDSSLKSVRTGIYVSSWMYNQFKAWLGGHHYLLPNKLSISEGHTGSKIKPWQKMWFLSSKQHDYIIGLIESSLFIVSHDPLHCLPDIHVD